MFVRRKSNASGSTSVQIVDKSSGRFRVVRSLGVGWSESDLVDLERAAYRDMERMRMQGSLGLSFAEDSAFLASLSTGLESVVPVGPELVLGKLYDEVGFGAIPEELFRHLVVSRLVNPGSKLRTVDYLRRHCGIEYHVDEVYRFMDRIHSTYQTKLEEISFKHTSGILGGVPQVVFYDVTTLYFEAEDEDDLRKAGYSKDGKHQNPQIVLGLLVAPGGYPLAFQIFEGNTFEGGTILPVVDAFKERLKVGKVVVIADSGLLSKKNVAELSALGYDYILGGRIKAEKADTKEAILAMRLKHGQSKELPRGDGARLIVSYSDKRAKKDHANRLRGYNRLKQSLGKGKLTKEHINNKGYNKYLKLKGDTKVEMDDERFEKDGEWDGLKGYVTNTDLKKEEVIAAYGDLWQIERAFRVSKTDLRVRPIYHRLRKRIEAHLCIAFCSYKVYKELERRLAAAKSHLSVEKAIEIVKTIFEIKVTMPVSKRPHKILFLKDPDQKHLLDILGINR
jgi:transposase